MTILQSVIYLSIILFIAAGPEEKFRIWLRERYQDVHERLKELMHHHNPRVQELALCTIAKLIESEGNVPIIKVSAKDVCFPVSKYEVHSVFILRSVHIE